MRSLAVGSLGSTGKLELSALPGVNDLGEGMRVLVRRSRALVPSLRLGSSVVVSITILFSERPELTEFLLIFTDLLADLQQLILVHPLHGRSCTRSLSLKPVVSEW